jgi:16S rRNA G966 N2-methylase RsmD
VKLGEDQVRELVNQAGVGARPESAELRQKLFETLWLNLKNVGELGSLVQVGEGVTRVLDEWVEAQARAKGITKLIRNKESAQLSLESIDLSARRERVQQMELERKVIEDEAKRIRFELLAGLEQLAGQLQADPRQRLFAEDTVRGLKLLEVLSQAFDVVVMNPPYGAFVPEVKEFIDDAYPMTKSDIYAAFIERATQLIEPEGYVGALVSSTFKTNVTHTKLRTEILLKRNPLVVMLDLGFGILDGATVEAAALVLRGNAL